MASMILSGDTSGAITVTVPAVAGTNTITLPAATGTVLVSGNQPAFAAYSSTNQTITSGVATKVTLDTEEFDTNSNFASSRFTPTVAGYYQINAETYCQGTATTYIHSRVYKNGSLYKIGTHYNGTAISEFGSTCAAVIYCNGSTDYIELYQFTTCTGSPVLIGGATFYTYMSGALVRNA